MKTKQRFDLPRLTFVVSDASLSTFLSYGGGNTSGQSMSCPEVCRGDGLQFSCIVGTDSPVRFLFQETCSLARQVPLILQLLDLLTIISMVAPAPSGPGPAVAVDPPFATPLLLLLMTAAVALLGTVNPTSPPLPVPSMFFVSANRSSIEMGEICGAPVRLPG